MSNSFWSDHTLEPKRSMRWVLYISNIPTFIIKTTDKPSFTLSEAKHSYINHSFYFPGRVEWQPLKVTLVDPIAPDASRTIMDIIRRSGYHFPEDSTDTSTISKKNAVEALGSVIISQLDADGNPVESWELRNAWIKDPKFGSLDYTKDDLTELEITIRYDYAELTLSGQGVQSPNNL